MGAVFVTDVLTFEQALATSSRCTKRHLLLGNGFSIACFPEIFHYGSLFSRADFSSAPHLLSVFENLDTEDFETVIRHLEAASRLISVYLPRETAVAERMKSDAASIKEILLQTIAHNHPDYPGSVSEDKYQACRDFLANFLTGNSSGQIYTLNYDLLLYWAVMHGEDEATTRKLNPKDGFGNDEDDPWADYVVWQGETGAHSAKIHFLHGALHLFDAGDELQKYTWVRKGERLIDQARHAISIDKFPVFVSEGNSYQKKKKIRHNAYLYQGFKQLTANALKGTHCFFVHGHSMDGNDDHILKRLARGKFPELYVSLYGDPLSTTNQAIIRKAESLALERNQRFPLKVRFYDAASAKPWG
ncbi:MAG: DUF4917 family protein [Thalassospira sp.]|nr:DUF4917 family protein [Thalassospira sp.]MBO6839586.1 DUF4917 family protein [Thalassospira sp.]